MAKVIELWTDVQFITTILVGKENNPILNPFHKLRKYIMQVPRSVKFIFLISQKLPKAVSKIET
jgi:hypothetical protein